MGFINYEDAIGQTLIYLTQNITGSEIISLFLIMIIVVLIGLVFKIPFNLILIFSLPLLIVLAAYTSVFVPVLILAGLILALQLVITFLGK